MATLTPQQKQALDPYATIWVTASAGSGKTKVLTDRLLTLMLSGTPPERLLCLTFTKAAAAEMANRLQQCLSQWVIASEEVLRHALKDLGFEGTIAQRTRARRLFTELLDTPGGFKIQTLHSFCQSLLGRFPLEAKLAPHFTVLEDREAHSFLHQAQNDIFQQASDQQESHLTEALQHLAMIFSESTIRSLLVDCIVERNRQGVSAILEEEGPKEKEIEEKLARFFDFPAPFFGKELQEKDERERETTLSYEDTRRLNEALKGGSPRDQTGADILLRRFNDPSPETKEAYENLFVTQAGEPRKRLVSSQIARTFPFIEEGLLREQEHLLRLRERTASRTVYLNSVALLRLASAIQERYQALKRQKAALDYDDLIISTLRLLHSSQGALWVLYKLDNSLDHILIDEAQDTNPEQWQVIRGLADAFFETHERSKTLFIVGDPKQSIYSFQGANPLAFSFMRHHVQHKVETLQRPFREVELHQSFRSSPVILQTVDWVFQAGPFLEGISTHALTHDAFHQMLPGQIDVWPLLECDPKKPSEEIKKEESPSLASIVPETLLAQEIAHQILGWLEEGLPLSHGPLRPRDILILVRRRGRLMKALVKACKDLHIPVAGVDRMALHESLAIADLLKLAEFCLLPTDDLTLAIVLKGPLIRLSEEKLFELSYKRDAQSLWYRLKQKALSQSQPPALYDCYQGAYLLLSRLALHAQTLGPFAFFSAILNQEKGRQKIIERLGFDVADALDEFIALSLVYEKSHTPTLQGFVDWMTKHKIEIKRNMEVTQRDEVRILTVHGSKGLEAPLVILPDTAHPPTDLPSLLWVEIEGTLVPCVTPPDAQTPEKLRVFKNLAAQKQQEEYHRLLYVALTRARERLCVCGWKKERALSEKSWYHAIIQALKAQSQVTVVPFQGAFSAWQGETLRLAAVIPYKVQELERDAPHALGLKPSPLPEWVLQNPPLEQTFSETTVTRQLQETLDRELSFTPETATAETAQQRGRILHYFLEKLAAVPRLGQREKGEILASNLSCDPLLRDGCLEESLRLLSHPDLQWLWGPEGLSEVSVEGKVGEQWVSGRIDRLVVTPEKVYLIDFKTDRSPDLVLLPPVYAYQLELYRSLLRSLYAQPIVCGVLWTLTGVITWLETFSGVASERVS